MDAERHVLEQLHVDPAQPEDHQRAEVGIVRHPDQALVPTRDELLDEDPLGVIDRRGHLLVGGGHGLVALDVERDATDVRLVKSGGGDHLQDHRPTDLGRGGDRHLRGGHHGGPGHPEANRLEEGADRPRIQPAAIRRQFT